MDLLTITTPCLELVCTNMSTQIWVFFSGYRLVFIFVNIHYQLLQIFDHIAPRHYRAWNWYSVIVAFLTEAVQKWDIFILKHRKFQCPQQGLSLDGHDLFTNMSQSKDVLLSITHSLRQKMTVK